MTAQRDTDQINLISLWFELAPILDLGNRTIMHIKPYSDSGWRCGPGTAFRSNVGSLKFLCMGIPAVVYCSFIQQHIEYCLISHGSTQP